MASDSRQLLQLLLLAASALELSTAGSAFCQRGIVGTQLAPRVTGGRPASVCCRASCGKCEQAGCSSRPGGMKGCCLPAIFRSSRLCRAPSDDACILPRTLAANVSAPTGQAFCTTGISASSNAAAVCCPSACGKCDDAWPDCRRRPGGVDACCAYSILRSARYCQTPEDASCILPLPPVATLCTDGIVASRSSVGTLSRGPATVCCSRSCGTCGGWGCGSRPGGGSGCCLETIVEKGRPCWTRTDTGCVLLADRKSVV